MKKFLIWLVVVIVLVLIGWFVWRIISGGLVDDAPDTAQDNLQNQVVVANDQSIDDVDDPFLQEPAIAFDDLSSQIKGEYKNDPEFQFCANEVVQGCLTQSIGKKITETGDLEFCNDFLTSEGQESCRVAQSYNLARTKKDPSFCAALDQQQKLTCLSEVAAIQAFDSQDLSKCDVVGEEKEQCVSGAAYRLAIETRDAQWCENIVEDQREFCVQEIAFQQEELERQKEIEAEFEQQRIAEEAEQAEQNEAQLQQQEAQQDEVIDEVEQVDADVVEEVSIEEEIPAEN